MNEIEKDFQTDQNEIKIDQKEIEIDQTEIETDQNEIKTDQIEIGQNEIDQNKIKIDQNVAEADQIDRVEFIRFLLSLTEKLDKQKLELISMTLCYELLRPNGICNLINASIDLDESSQKVTTHNQRFMKLSLIIAGLPKLCCSLEQFFESICDQLIRILLNTSDESRENRTTKLINTLIVTICSALYRRNKRLFSCKFLSVLFNCFFHTKNDNQINESNLNPADLKRDGIKFDNELEEEFKRFKNDKSINESNNEKGNVKFETAESIEESINESIKESSKESSNKLRPIIRLKINETIKITLLLLMNRFEKKEIVKYFKQFLFIKCVLADLECSLNKNLEQLLNELLMNIKNSQYLIDKTLFEEGSLDEFDRYKVQLDVDLGIKTVILKSADQIKRTEDNEIELKKIDQITQCTVKLICSRSDSYKIDTFLLLLARYSQKRQIDHQSSLLICSLIDTLMKNIITPEGLVMLINFPDKAIDFVNLTLERLTLSYDSIYELSTVQTVQTAEDDELERAIKEDSLNMCLQIIDFVLKKQLFQSLFENLKQTLDNFVTVVSKGKFNEEIRKRAVDLQDELKSKSFISMNKYKEDTVFKQAIEDLNSNLMPERAHALIALKKLIYSKNSNIQSNKAQLITVLKECLQDEESYIFLSAINTLAALALNYTDDVLPILIESFNDKHRTPIDRLKVGQVIVYLSKQLNEMAHCYAKSIMNMLFRASKDEFDLIRVSALSNLAEFCSVLKFKLNLYISEIMICIEYTLQSDPSIEVKRACVMFFHLLLNNLDLNTLPAIKSELRNMIQLLQRTYDRTLDDLIRLHAQLALEQLNRIANEIIESLETVPTTVQFRLK